MKKQFEVNPALCTGCMTCELACSFAHAENGQQGRSRIIVLPGGFPDLYVPVTCLQCDDATCVKSCLVNAITRNPETGALDLSQEKCVKCMACVSACPFGCALVDETHNQVVKCDLCHGDPVCAKFCPTKALSYKSIEDNKARQAG